MRPSALRDVTAPLEANFASMEAIYRIGVGTGDYGAEADRLSVEGTTQLNAAIRALSSACWRASTRGRRAGWSASARRH